MSLVACQTQGAGEGAQAHCDKIGTSRLPTFDPGLGEVGLQGTKKREEHCSFGHATGDPRSALH
jgi:hypothetical protein